MSQRFWLAQLLLLPGELIAGRVDWREIEAAMETVKQLEIQQANSPEEPRELRQ